MSARTFRALAYGMFLLSACAEPRVDLHLEVSALSYVLTEGKSASGDVRFMWMSGDAGAVDFELRNVPPGVEVEKAFTLSPGETKRLTFVASGEAKEGVYTVPLVGRSNVLVKFARLTVTVKGTPGRVDQSFNSGTPVGFCAQAEVRSTTLLVEQVPGDFSGEGFSFQTVFTLMGSVGASPAVFLYVPDAPGTALSRTVVGLPQQEPFAVQSGIWDGVNARWLLSGRSGGRAQIWSLAQHMDNDAAPFGTAGVVLADLASVNALLPRGERLWAVGTMRTGMSANFAVQQFDVEGIPAGFQDGIGAVRVVDIPGTGELLRAVTASPLPLLAGARLDVGGKNSLLVALGPEGKPEPFLATGGIWSHSFSAGDDELTDVAFDRFLAGFVAGVADDKAFVAKVSFDGQLDGRFGSAGVLSLRDVLPGTPVKVLKLENGDLLAAGSDALGAWVTKLLPQGGVDAGFGDGGSVSLQGMGTLVDLALTPDARLMVLTNGGGCAHLVRLWL